MMRCTKCNVDYTGYQKKCPLCQRPLVGEPTPAVFPHNLLAAPRAVALAVLGFSSGAGVAALVALGLLGWVPTPYLLLAGVAVVANYFFVRNILRRMSGFVRAASRYVFVLVAIALVWFALTGFGPAVTLALPIVVLCAFVFDVTMLAVMRSAFVRDYAKYPILDILCGFVPFVLSLTGAVPRTPLVVITAFVSVLLALALFAFVRRALMEELRKLFNLG